MTAKPKERKQTFYEKYVTSLLPDDETRFADDRLLGVRHAAGYLAISTEALRAIRREGKIPYVQLRNRQNQNQFYFRLSDLNEFILRCRINRRVWDEDSEELPMKAIAKLLDITFWGVHSAMGANTFRLKDRTYKSVRAYIIHQVRRKFYHEAQLKYRNKVQGLKVEISRLRKRLAKLKNANRHPTT